MLRPSADNSVLWAVYSPESWERLLLEQGSWWVHCTSPESSLRFSCGRTFEVLNISGYNGGSQIYTVHCSSFFCAMLNIKAHFVQITSDLQKYYMEIVN